MNRAVINGWDAPQHIRDAICDQLDPAMQAYRQRMDSAATPSARLRAAKHIVKMVSLALKMEATNRITEGQPKTWFPYLRKRYPEKRSRRRPHREQVQRQEEALHRLLEKLGRRNAPRAVE